MSVSPNSNAPSGQVRLDDLIQVCHTGTQVDDALLKEMLGLFIGENTRRVGAVRNAAQLGNQKELRETLHALKGSAALIGADRLRSLAGDMEADVVNATGRDPLSACEELQREFNAVVATLRARYPDLPPA